jgi:hypothetical protein
MTSYPTPLQWYKKDILSVGMVKHSTCSHRARVKLHLCQVLSYNCSKWWRNQGKASFFSAHLSWKRKWAFLIAFCPSSVCPSVWRLSVSLFHFQLLLQNRWANFNQSWHKSFLGKEDSELNKWRTTPFPKGR